MDLDNAALSIGQSPALIVVDAIKGFTDPNCALGHDCDRAMVHINRLIDAFHTRRAPVALTTVVYDDPSQASVFRRKLPALNLLERAEIWHEFDPRLHRSDTDLIIDYLPDVPRGLASRKVATAHVFVVVPCDHPMAEAGRFDPALLRDTPFVSYHPSLRPSYRDTGYYVYCIDEAEPTDISIGVAVPDEFVDFGEDFDRATRIRASIPHHSRWVVDNSDDDPEDTTGG